MYIVHTVLKWKCFQTFFKESQTFLKTQIHKKLLAPYRWNQSAQRHLHAEVCQSLFQETTLNKCSSTWLSHLDKWACRVDWDHANNVLAIIFWCDKRQVILRIECCCNFVKEYIDKIENRAFNVIALSNQALIVHKTTVPDLKLYFWVIAP